MTVVQSLLPLNAVGIPHGLRPRPRWAPWHARWDPGRGKWDKVPRSPTDPQRGLSTAQPQLWGSLDEALQACASHPDLMAGVGYCLTRPHGVVAVDLDDCVTDGLPDDWAVQVIRSLGSYAERSPSGRGFRILGLGAIDADWANHERGIEVYGGHGARFVTITGQHLAGTPEDMMPFDPFALEDLQRQYAKARPTASIVSPMAMPECLDELALPNLKALPLTAAVRDFLEHGTTAGDRSATLHAAGIALYEFDLDDVTVFSILASNVHAMAVALDHRHQNRDRALQYLWKEHCLKARSKAVTHAALLQSFNVVPAAPLGSSTSPSRPSPPAFRRDQKGLIEATINNLMLALGQPAFCGMELRLDEFRDEIVFSAPGLGQWQPFKDADYVRLRQTLENKGFKPLGRELVRDAVMLAAEQNRFDTAQEWLRPLVWDGVERVETFLPRYLGTEDTPYTRAVSRYLWTALAGRVMAPGTKADMVPILIGAQGVGKSRAVAALAPSQEFFTEIALQDRDDDLARLMRGRLVAELGELRGLHSKDLESIKAFVSRTHERWTPKYREFAVQYPRRIVFVGSTNSQEFLSDTTGNRRWLPVTVMGVDVEAIVRDRDQFWAEARERFALLGVEHRDAERMSAQVHGDHMIGDTWETTVSDWSIRPEPLTGEVPAARGYLRAEDVLRHALGYEDRHIRRVDQMRLGDVLRKLGYTRKKKRVNGHPCWVYVPSTPAAQARQEQQWERNSPSGVPAVPSVPTSPYKEAGELLIGCPGKGYETGGSGGHAGNTGVPSDDGDASPACKDLQGGQP